MTTSFAGSHDDVRRNNLSRILRRLHLGGAASRSELVSVTGLNRSTVGALVADLTEVGLVTEQSGTAGSVGRPSLVVVPVAGSAFVLAFDFRVDRIVAAVIGIGGSVLARTEQRHHRSGYGPDLAVRQLAQIARELVDAVPEGAIWVGTAIGVPGIVDAGRGLVKLAPNLGWTDVPIGELLESSLTDEFGEVPQIVIGNDADLGAIAEHSRGVASGAANVIYLSGEIGIGGGLVLGDVPLAGAGGFGGEVGHMVVNPTGAICRCGSRGCWETVIGRDAVIRGAQAEQDTELDDVVSAALAGDQRANESLREFGWWLGSGLRNLVNIFNPNVIVLGGHLGVLYPHVEALVQEQLDTSIRASREQVCVVVPGLGEDSTLIGAAETGFAPLLASPLETIEASSTLVAS